MKKKLLAILMVAAMSMSFIACGGSEDEGAANNNVAVENGQNAATEQVEEATEGPQFSDEQIALAEEYLQLTEDYDAIVDKVNASEELLANQELVDVMNELTDALVGADECFGDPTLLTDEVMAELRKAFDETYVFIDGVNELLGATEAEVTVEDLASVFTIGFVGADANDNTYYFICDEEIISAGLVILSADTTQNLMCIGDVVENSDGSLTLTDVDGEYQTTFTAEPIEGGLTMVFDGELEVTMVPYEVSEVIDMMLTIEAETQNVN